MNAPRPLERTGISISIVTREKILGLVNWYIADEISVNKYTSEGTSTLLGSELTQGTVMSIGYLHGDYQTHFTVRISTQISRGKSMSINLL